MKNFSIAMKRFISNKNTVTILCTIAAILVLWVGYNMRVKSATKPVKVPYAVNTIEPQQQITKEDIDYMYVARDNLSEVYYRDVDDIIGKYVKLESTIHEGSFF